MNKYELEISEDNIFKTINQNILNRNKDLIQLVNILNNVNENIIISVDGKWGTGKTFFVQQFKYLLENLNKFPDNKIFSGNEKNIIEEVSRNNIVIYYNAWENDDHKDPIESLMYSILNEYGEQKDLGVKFEDLKKCLLGFVRDFIYASSMTAIDLNNFDKLNSFEDLSKAIKTTEEKKESFYELLKNITKSKRVILIIDEIDRCNPIYAVKILETIKHFYNYDKISIIVSTNNLELSKTIKKFYGYDFDGYGYLSKIYDLIISLEIKDIKKYIQMNIGLCNKTWFSQDVSYELMNYYKFSLRECNRFGTLYRILENYIEKEDMFNRNEELIIRGLIIPIAIVLKIADIEKYNEFINNDNGIILKDILNKVFDNKQQYVEWLKELSKNTSEVEDYKDKIIDVYKKAFDDFEYKENGVPIIKQATSLLGNNLKLLADKTNK